MTFTEIYTQYDWGKEQQSILQKTPADVRRALNNSKRDVEDFKALISPAAGGFLEEMAQLSQKMTQKRFGKTIQMYIPLYLSNECQNICTYCAFSVDNPIKRRTLNNVEILQEAAVIKEMGFEHILLVTGEANKTVGLSYLKNAIHLLKPLFSNISMEVQPMDYEDYQTLVAEGLHSVLVYQETYHDERYKAYHPKGKKSNFNYRLETPDRLGKAQIHKIGLGTLIGLEDWRTDCFFTALHLRYLQKQYWQTKYSISFPRLRPIELEKEGFHTRKDFEKYMQDRELVQLICAWRIFDEELEISLSTREEEKFRDHLIHLGITSISAGSKTNPGGYIVDLQALEQFEISDERSPKEIANRIKAQGYQPVWKDWDNTFIG